MSIGKKYPTNCIMSMKKEIALSSVFRKLLLRLSLGRIVSNVLVTQSIKVVTTSIRNTTFYRRLIKGIIRDNFTPTIHESSKNKKCA